MMDGWMDGRMDGWMDGGGVGSPGRALNPELRGSQADLTGRFGDQSMNRTPHDSTRPRVLLVGYNGANNTGAEALLLADIADVRSVFGTGVSLTVPTMSPANLRRYLQEGRGLSIVPISPVFLGPLRRLVAQHDLVMLVEGSTYMDTWTQALLWCFLWATHCATSRGIPCLAYAVDSGTLSPFNRWLVRHVAGKTDQIIVRSHAAARRLRSWGVAAPLQWTADNAFTFSPHDTDRGLLDRAWPDHGRPVVGIAPVDFSLWPVVMRPFGKREFCYRWPYYFSHSRSRSQVARRQAQTYAAFADWVVQRYDAAVVLLCMEQLDEPLAGRIQELMGRRDRARVFSARHYNASQMTAVLRGLDFLVTSRFHAAVLSLAEAIPQLAIGHDLRLKALYDDLGISQECFIDPPRADLPMLQERFNFLRDAYAPVKHRLSEGYAEHARRAARNRLLLEEFARAQGWGQAS